MLLVFSTEIQSSSFIEEICNRGLKSKVKYTQTEFEKKNVNWGLWCYATNTMVLISKEMKVEMFFT